MRGISGPKEETGVFLELLAERHTNEVLGTGLFDSLIHRCGASQPPGHSLRSLDVIRDQKLTHIRLLERSVRLLNGVLPWPFAGAGRIEWGAAFLQSMVREGTLLESLEALLFTELRDEMGWEVLHSHARACLGPLAWEFRGALLEEREHVRRLREGALKARELLTVVSWPT